MKNEIGVQIVYRAETDIEWSIKKAKDMELASCQLCIWDESLYSESSAARINAAVKELDFKISSVWAGWSGPAEWNFTYGPSTIGLVPVAYRRSRAEALKRAGDFAARIGVDKIVTHVGFIPENPDDPNFYGTVAALREVCSYLKKKGIFFLFETGQETPITMLRTIQAIGMDNVGINFDTVNLMLYGKANSLDALDIFGQYVMETHIKDGFYPTDGMELGRQCPVGEGSANLPAIVKRLQEIGYCGTFTIEREIEGEQQLKDILSARDLLREWMK